jgi:cytochrome c oxidase accessory protein FixG
VISKEVPEKIRTSEETLLQPESRVLPTLECDGSRRWIQPQLASGRLWRFRRVVAYVLMAVFVLIPHLRFAGKPLVLLDVPARQFTILGHTFLPTDTLLLALMMLCVFLTVVLGTAMVGRVWCGWACPQTVYLEFLFRPIDRLLSGTVGKGGTAKKPATLGRQLVRWGVYLLLSMFLAHTFLAYFVGTERLAHWVRSSPTQHPVAFLVMGATTALMLFDFLFFREQLCMIACPYGRFQSVMLDRRSLIVAYDVARGEPRHKGKKVPGAASGDCVSCNRCVTVCPTGIDIRDGLQLECINCTQCIDACNEVMDRVGLPQGLIRYSSQDALEGKKGGMLRPRTVIYPLLLLIVASAFIYVLTTKFAFDARIIRAPGAPFTVVDGAQVQNNLRLRLVNRSEVPQNYTIVPLAPEALTVSLAEQETPHLDPGKTTLAPLVLRFPAHLTTREGKITGRLEIVDSSGNRQQIECQLLGPR